MKERPVTLRFKTGELVHDADVADSNDVVCARVQRIEGAVMGRVPRWAPLSIVIEASAVAWTLSDAVNNHHWQSFIPAVAVTLSAWLTLRGWLTLPDND